ncbi:zincin [Thozetella sp. PMI_491]|nr:zincin [Thozetella sp. PMI_491]
MENQHLRLRPSHAPPLFAETPDSIRKEVQNVKAQYEDVHKAIINAGDGSLATFENTMLPLVVLYNSMVLSEKKAGILAAASNDEEIRKAATQAQDMLQQLFSDRTKRVDTFQRLQTIYQQKDEISLDAESEKLLQDWYDEYNNNGCALPEDQRKQLEEVDRQISTLRSQFRKGLFESTAHLWLTREQLDGLPISILDGLEVSDGKVRFPLKTSLVISAMNGIHDASVRKLIHEEEELSISENVATFTNLMQAKQQRAGLVGYSSFAEMALRKRMAKHPKVVDEFLGSLQKALTPKALEELTKLKELRKQHLETTGAGVTDGYYLWDQRYYHEMHLRASYEVDNAQIAEYFPVEPALSGMLQIFEDVFNIEIIEADAKKRAELAEHPEHLTWHEDVGMYTVWEKNAKTEEDFIGYLYTDLTIRDGKYPHCANFNICPGYTDENGARRPVATALMCSFPPSSSNKPVLLTHYHIVQMFHELGHGMHDLLSRTRYVVYHGHGVARDFVEMPSQMLEGWCWNPGQLASISRHYAYLSSEYADAWRAESGKQDLPPERLPEQLAVKLAATQVVDIALSTLRQIAFSKFDMYIHGEAEFTSDGLKAWYLQNRDSTGLIPSSDQDPPRLCHEFATMVHFVEGSSSSYYAYLFSKVYSADIFHSAFEKHLRDGEVGMKYRRMVLQPGGSQDPLEMVRSFLGREPSPAAFHRSIGLDTIE